MKSPVVKRSIVIAGHKTSVSLEEAFWKGLKEIANNRNLTLSDVVASIDTDRHNGNLSSAIRLFVLEYYRAMIGEQHGAKTAPRPRLLRAYSSPPLQSSPLQASRSSRSRCLSGALRRWHSRSSSAGCRICAAYPGHMNRPGERETSICAPS